MSSDDARLSRFLAEDCPACGMPGPQRHLSAVGGCATCAENDPRPVFTPVRNAAINVYDMVLPEPYTGPYWAPFRKGGLTSPLPARCYWLPGGAVVHVKPECRCP